MPTYWPVGKVIFHLLDTVITRPSASENRCKMYLTERQLTKAGWLHISNL